MLISKIIIYTYATTIIIFLYYATRAAQNIFYTDNYTYTDKHAE